MKERFKFHMPTQVVCEQGVSKRLGDYICGGNVLLISDPFLYRNGTAAEIGQAMTGKEVVYFSEIEPNPSCESVDAAAGLAREIKADCVIGLGGGSSLDVSKIVSCLTTNDGSIYDYYSTAKKKLSPRRTGLICIPTTAGTGSEVTNVGVFTNKKTRVKLPMVNHEFWPDLAVIDPELTRTLPPVITASTGMDAFCHAIEAYWNQESQPICDMLAMGAMELILAHVKQAYDEPENLEARGAMSMASLIAGIAFSQTRTTGIHAISFPLTAEFGASHGIACSITLPAFIRISVEKAAEKMHRLAARLGYDSVEAFADAVEALMGSMHMPLRLHALGVKEADIPHITEVALSAQIIHLTPAEMNPQTVDRLLRSIL